MLSLPQLLADRRMIEELANQCPWGKEPGHLNAPTPFSLSPFVPMGPLSGRQFAVAVAVGAGLCLHASGILQCLLVWLVDIACGKAIGLKQCVDEV